MTGVGPHHVPQSPFHRGAAAAGLGQMTVCVHAATLSRMTEVRFASSADVQVAYRVVGDGPIDLVYAQDACTHLDVYWELPAFRRYCERSELRRGELRQLDPLGVTDRRLCDADTQLEYRPAHLRAQEVATGRRGNVGRPNDRGA